MDDDAAAAAVLGAGMDRPVPPPSPVALAVTPRLLADSLMSLLADQGIAAMPLVAPFDEHVDLAVVTPEVTRVDADVVVQLDNGQGSTAVATVRGSSGGPLLRLEGLPAIIDFVRGWYASRVENAR